VRELKNSREKKLPHEGAIIKVLFLKRDYLRGVVCKFISKKAK
jgi:hypothetical protein